MVSGLTMTEDGIDYAAWDMAIVCMSVECMLLCLQFLHTWNMADLKRLQRTVCLSDLCKLSKCWV